MSFHQSFAAGVITIASLQLATVPVERQFQRQYILSKTSGTAFQQSIACSPTSVKQLFALIGISNSAQSYSVSSQKMMTASSFTGSIASLHKETQLSGILSSLFPADVQVDGL